MNLFLMLRFQSSMHVKNLVLTIHLYLHRQTIYWEKLA